MSTVNESHAGRPAADIDTVAGHSVWYRLKTTIGRPFSELWTRWQSFWFAPEDPFTLGIIRILTGWMLIYTLFVWGLDLQTFFRRDGLQPLSVILDFHRSAPVFSFWHYVSDGWLTTVHWACVGVAFLFFLGIGTRITSVAAFLITISYSQRVPVANFGLDQILGLLCLYLAIGPSGACLSVDSWVRSRAAKKNGTVPECPKRPSARVALRLIQLHLCVIYFWAGFSKLKGDSWWTGEAFWQVLANQEYQTIDLTWMAWWPWLSYLLAHVTVAWEVFFCVLIWNQRLRPLMLAIGIGMHIGIGAFLGMWTFGLIMTFAYFSFSDPPKWRQRVSRIFARPAAETVLPDDVIADVVAELQPASEHDTQPEKPETPQEQQISAASVRSPGPVDEAPRHSAANRPEQPEQTDENETEIFSIAPQLSLAPSGVLSKDSHPDADKDLPTEDAALLLVSMHPEERSTLRSYFRKHDIPCRAATTPENALSLVIPLMPAAIVVSGSRMKPGQLSMFLEDIHDLSDAPLVAILSRSQYRVLKDVELPARIIVYPASPREIRHEISNAVFGDQTAEETSHRKRKTMQNRRSSQSK